VETGGTGLMTVGGGTGATEVAATEESPRIPSLKLRIPSPIPRMTSGMRRPPNKSTITAINISQWIGLNSPIVDLLGLPSLHFVVAGTATMDTAYFKV
jgi:hypothetical protein